MKDKPVLLPVGGSFEIEYVNTEGIGSRRVIDVRKFVTNLSDGYVQAFCHERKMVRTFKYQSIMGLVDLETGEVVEPSLFRRRLQERYEEAPERQMDFFIREMKPIVDVLVYIAYCDGKYAPSEQRYIAQWLTDKSEMGDDFLAYSLSVMKSWSVPDSMDFSFAIRAINQRFPDWRDSVLEYARNVAKADRKVTDEETNQLKILERLFAVFGEKAW
jgi:hypothetical protein